MLVPVVIHKDRISDYGVTVPALPGCFSAGESIDEALIHARQAIELHLEGMLEDGELLPEMLPVEAFQRRREYRGGIWFMVEINPSRLMSGARRVNITLPEHLLTQIDRAAADSGKREQTIAQASRQAIRLRQQLERQASLLEGELESGRNRSSGMILARAGLLEQIQQGERLLCEQLVRRPEGRLLLEQLEAAQPRES